MHCRGHGCSYRRSWYFMEKSWKQHSSTTEAFGGAHMGIFQVQGSPYLGQQQSVSFLQFQVQGNFGKGLMSFWQVVKMLLTAKWCIEKNWKLLTTKSTENHWWKAMLTFTVSSISWVPSFANTSVRVSERGTVCILSTDFRGLSTRVSAWSTQSLIHNTTASMVQSPCQSIKYTIM